MWYIKQKATNKQTLDTDNSMVVTRGDKGWGEESKRVKYMTMEGE